MPIDSKTEQITAETSGAQTLRRGLSILKLLARYQANGLGVSDIARKLQLNKATTVRLARTLVDEQFLVQEPRTRSYRLGPEAFAVGLAAEPHYALQRRAEPLLRALALETGDWVFFSVRSGSEAVCLSRESGESVPFPQASLRVGDRHPLGLGAAGMAMLAAMPEDEASVTLESNFPAIAKQYPQMTRDVVLRLLKKTQAKGYSLIPGILAPDYWGVGVAVIDGEHKPVAAIVLITSASRLPGAREAVIAARLKRISQELILFPSQ